MNPKLRRTAAGLAFCFAFVAAALGGPAVAASPAHPLVQATPAMAGLGDHSRESGRGGAWVGTAPTQRGPSAVAVDAGTDTIYVANGNNANGGNAGGNTVSVIDGRRCQARDVSRCAGPWPTIVVGELPTALTVDQETHTVYVALASSNTVSVFNAAACNARTRTGCGQVPARVTVGGGAVGIYADSADQTVYVPNFGDFDGTTVSMIDTRHCHGSDFTGCSTQTPSTVTVGVGPGDVDINRATHTAYVVNLSGVSVFDAATCNAHTAAGCRTVGTLTICPGACFGPFQAKVDARTNTVYTANGDNTVSVFDAGRCNSADLGGCADQTPGTVTVSSPLFFEHAIALAVDSRAHTVYVSSQKDDTLAVIDTGRCNGTHRGACALLTPQTIHTGSDPEGVAVNPDTHTVYVAAQVDNAISVIDERRCDAGHLSGCRHPAPTVAVPSPGVPAADQAVHTLYVPDVAGASVALLDTLHCNALDTGGCSAPHRSAPAQVAPLKALVDAARHTVFVVNHGAGTSGSVSVLDASTCNAQTTASCRASSPALNVSAGNPVDIVEDPGTGSLYIATLPAGGPPLISVFDGATCNATTVTGCGQIPSVIRLPAPSTGTAINLALDPGTHTVYATVLDTSVAPAPYIGSSVYVINTATCNSRVRTGCGQGAVVIPNVGDNPLGVAVDLLTHAVYTANLANGEGPGTISIINGTTCNGAVVTGCSQKPTKVATGFGTVDVAVDPATGTVYTANIEDASVSVIDRDTCNTNKTGDCRRSTGRIDVALAPDHIILAPWICTAYASSGTTDTVSILRLREGTCRPDRQ